MSFNPKYGLIGLVAFPYYWVIEVLGPIIEFGGYIYVIVAFFSGSIYYEMAILILLMFIINGVIFSILAVLFEAWSMNVYPKISDTFRLVLLSFTEIFWYRPLTLLWRLEGMYSFLINKKEWGNMQRIGMSGDEKTT